MAQPYDASLKELVEGYPADWLRLAGLHTAAPIDVIDADVSTVTAAADKVFRVRETPPWLLHLELQSSPKGDLAGQLHWYNALLRHRHRHLVRTVLVLLRPAADSPRLTGVYHEQFAGEAPYLEFRYRVLRVWQQPVQALLTGGLGTLPLAPVSDVAEAAVPGILEQVRDQLQQGADPEQAKLLRKITYIVCGLRLPKAIVEEMFLRVFAMDYQSILRDSSVFQEPLAEATAKARAQARAEALIEGRAAGRAEEGKALLIRMGTKRWGPPDASTRASVDSLTDLEKIERLADRLDEVAGWQELLAAG